MRGSYGNVRSRGENATYSRYLPRLTMKSEKAIGGLPTRQQACFGVDEGEINCS
jgi:hypothetical protein